MAANVDVPLHIPDNLHDVNNTTQFTPLATPKKLPFEPASHDTGPIDYTVFKNVINGELTTTKTTRHHINPSTLKPNPEFPVSTAEDLEKAIDAAHAAAPAWGDVSWDDRRKAIEAYADAIEANVDPLADLLVRELGLPLAFSLHEVNWGVEWLRDFCKLKLPENVIESGWNRHVVERYVPIGVTAGIVPWNGPAILASGKIAPALLTGNALILKPSPFAPYTIMKMVEIGQRFFPRGILQVLSGNDDLGPMLTSSPRIGKVSFTGSCETGQKVVNSCGSAGLKRMTLELGGNDPAIVLEDADPEVVGAKIAFTALLRSGQLCMAVKRLYIHESIYDAVLKEVVKYVENAKFGDGFEEGVIVGPIANRPQYERVKELLADIEKSKLKVIPENGTSTEGLGGYFIRPIVIDNPPEDSRVVVEEPFGPILPVMKWSDEEDVIRRANDTPYGLGASVWTKDLDRGNRIARRLEAGNVWVNGHAILQASTAFACHKESGFGSELGVHGLAGWCNIQSVYVLPQ
ncbi:aldehyde dehydrogenase [Nemania abortiva]|nr:aldehyde dehydrogenase [Nemania abortiva]